VACGVDQTIVLVDSGRLFAMGNNANGQLGFYSQV
jgi:alpha-tubulin suppressor-like RCC1 family protein